MSPDEARIFEELLNKDTELKTNYQDTLTARRLIIEAGRMDLKSAYESFDTELKPVFVEKNIMPLWIKRSLPIAAVLVVFFGIYQFGFFSKSLSNSEVFSYNFETYAAPSTLRNNESNVPVEWASATDYYRNQEYEKALALYDKVEADIPSYMVFFYKGMSYMAQSKPNYILALQNFKIVQESDNDFRQQALWYQGLALLKLDKRQEALEIFKEISESKFYNFEKADAILTTKFKD
jgi:tetratricopeptide (TPR) repeat protein